MSNDLIILKKYVEKISTPPSLSLLNFFANPAWDDCHTPSRFRSLVRLLFVCWLLDVCMWTTLCICIEWERKIRREKIWHLQRLMISFNTIRNHIHLTIILKHDYITRFSLFLVHRMIWLVLMWLDMHDRTFLCHE